MRPKRRNPATLDSEPGGFTGGFPAPSDNQDRPVKGWRPGSGPSSPSANNQPPAMMPEADGGEPHASHDGEPATGGNY